MDRDAMQGNMVVFHMEECPEEDSFQTELYTASQMIITALGRRYPDKTGNIITLITSNHPPAQACAPSKP